jgi:DNA-binding transcriptional LysR family regulator
MRRENYNDVIGFIAVARERSFTRAADQLGITQSALSHSISSLEKRLGIRLLMRTTRSVSPTEAGEQLLENVAPRFEEIEAQLSAIRDLRDKPSGTIRITATDFAIDQVLWPRLQAFLIEHPDVTVEMISDYGLADIVDQRYDMGVRMGDDVAVGMIAVRISADIRFVIVAAPSYLKDRPVPLTPQDLANHSCINLRLPTRGGCYAWQLCKGKEQVNVRVTGQLIFNGIGQITNAAVAGYGLAFMPEETVAPHIETGELEIVMEDWAPTFPGLHLYYASRHQPSLAMRLVVQALKYDA